MIWFSSCDYFLWYSSVFNLTAIVLLNYSFLFSSGIFFPFPFVSLHSSTATNSPFLLLWLGIYLAYLIPVIPIGTPIRGLPTPNVSHSFSVFITLQQVQKSIIWPLFFTPAATNNHSNVSSKEINLKYLFNTIINSISEYLVVTIVCPSSKILKKGKP